MDRKRGGVKIEVLIGGTFDRLHKGHRKIIESGKKLGKVTLGLVSDEFVKKLGKKGKKRINNYEKRRKELKKHFPKIRIVKINDEIGSSLKPHFEVIVVTKNTRKNAKLINKKRNELKIPPLLIVELPIELAKDGEPITSSRIRLGIINREGEVLRRVIKIKNEVRSNVLQIIKECGETYGYEIKKIYKSKFGDVSQRLIYYHLSKGVKEGIFQVTSVREEKKGCSWGSTVERKYYNLGPLLLLDD